MCDERIEYASLYFDKKGDNWEIYRKGDNICLYNNIAVKNIGEIRKYEGSGYYYFIQYCPMGILTYEMGEIFEFMKTLG